MSSNLNQLTSTGLTIESLSDILDDFSDPNTGFPAIYGADINLGASTPDGQAINIFATTTYDVLQALESVYNSFSLVNAYGIQIDNLVALNGIQRKNGTYTIANVQVTVSSALTLTGQDALVNNPSASVFTVSDTSGNQYQLQTTYSFSGAGTETLLFAAIDIGQIFTTPNTITIISTPQVGVTSVNNPSTSNDIIGVNEESDTALKIRQANSLQMGATGPADTLRAQLLNVPGITDAFVAENDTSSVVNGVAANGIQVIVNAPTATPATIAQVIYSKKTAGCAQTSSGSPQSYNITRPAGNIFTAYWYNAVPEALYIAFQILPINGVDSFSTSYLATQLAQTLVYRLNQSAFIGDVIRAMQVIAPNGYLQNVYVGTSSPANQQTVSPSAYVNYFTVSASNITITT